MWEAFAGKKTSRCLLFLLQHENVLPSSRLQRVCSKNQLQSIYLLLKRRMWEC